MVILFPGLICDFLIKALVFLCFSFIISPLSLCSTPNKHSDHTLRRGSNTLARKQHTSPAFQPPLPPVDAPGQGHGAGVGAGAGQVPQPSAEPQPQPQAPSGGSGSDASHVSLAQGLAALAAAQQLLAQHTEELR